ncbi:MarR family transcriptional regulator [Paracoccus versutus]|uniref:ArsR family transcriptional regulator n=1 Tax=Paracoccus versutus TaxID=34007 RepID=A0AAQ0HGJ7_PARVE|nr:helix-turn-helix domain-containing protein [Paracoccus versutus]KGJ07587.1 ArsR family transcriptional regulator [Paracoccus versutus]REG45866.1 ArsR family transcriptional regulator [Paracoccus versutus]WEJ77686.1 MarR family transcriptional regulator [Paracoccus versutus]
MLDLDVIDNPAAAVAALDPIKARLLAELSEPASAASLAARVGLTRQKVNYHLRVLEDHGLVRAVEQRQWGGLIERLMAATAASYVVSPAALGPIGADPARSNDRLSASYLIALAARILREVGALWRAARQKDKRLATLSIDSTIRFRSPAERAAFAADLTNAVAALATRYHDESAPAGRPHRLIVAAYPAPDEAQP